MTSAETKPTQSINNPEPTEYYYDVFSGQVILGKVALDIHIESGGHPADLRDLGKFLRSNEQIVVPESVHPGAPEVPSAKNWDRDDYVRYGQWLALVVEPPKSPRKQALSEVIINRARDMGLGPGIHPIISEKRFGTLSNFYIEAGIRRTHRIGTFKDWTTQDMVDYLQRMGKRLGRRPERTDIRRAYLSNPSHNPHTEAISRRFKGEGSLRRVMELAGYLSIELWGEQEYIDWGVRFIEANDGKIPTSRDMSYLSAQRLGPSSRTVMTKFGKLRSYQDQVETAYLEELARRETETKRKLDEIKYGIASGKLPAELFEDAPEESEKILRYGRYIVADAFLTDTMTISKLSIAKMSNPSVISDGFVRSIRKNYPIITAGDIESTALYLGVYDDIFPQDINILERLKLPDELRYSRRARKIDVSAQRA